MLKLNRLNPEYWLGMSMAVETLKERGVCLREVLKLDPENDLAKRGLVLMGEEVANPPALWKMAQYKTDWKTSLELKQVKKVRAKLPVRKVLGWSFLGILLIAVITGRPPHRGNQPLPPGYLTRSTRHHSAHCHRLADSHYHRYSLRSGIAGYPLERHVYPHAHLRRHSPQPLRSLFLRPHSI